MNTTSSPDPSAPGGLPAGTSPATANSFFGQLSAGHISLVGTGLNLLILVILVITSRGCAGTAPPPVGGGTTKSAATKRVEDVTLGEARELAEELGKVSDSLAPFLDARLKPLQDQLKTQGETLNKVAEKVLGP